MKYIECPDVLSFDDYHHTTSIFLGGGISNCPDWQQDLVAKLTDIDRLTLINPRRSSFDITVKSMSKAQIHWEHDHLSRSDGATFWFPCETLCPITLFELGVHAAKGRKVFVGCHPDYARKFDVIEQLALIDDRIVVRDTIAEIAADVREFHRRLTANIA